MHWRPLVGTLLRKNLKGANPWTLSRGGTSLRRKADIVWLVTTIGFFSVVRKEGDTDLTVRTRVREDLEMHGKAHLPSLGPITAGEGTDYPYRARVAPQALGEALGRMVEDIDYSNFKNAIAEREGYERAHVYAAVWRVLLGLAPKAQP